MLVARFRRLAQASIMTAGLAAVFAVIGFMAMRQLSHAHDTRLSLLQTRTVISDVAGLDIALRDTESAQRGYVLTGDPLYLAPYTAALPRIPILMRDMAQKIAGEERSQALMDALTPLVRQKLVELERTIDLRRAGGETAALQLVRTELGRHLMLGLEAVLASLNREQAGLLTRGLATVQRAEQAATWLTFAGTAAGVLMLLLASVILRATLARQRECTRQLRHAEAESRALASQLQLCFDHLTDGLALIRAQPDGHFVFERLNPAAQALLGLEDQPWSSCPVGALWPEDETRVLETRMARCASDGHRLFFDTVPGCPEGRIMHMTLVPARTTATGRVTLLLGSFHDVTGQAHLRAALRDNAMRATLLSELEGLAAHLATARDRAEQASRAKSRFLAGITHELRTPLNGILGYAQLLRLDGALSPLQTVRLDTMLETGRQLLETVNNLLELSEIEAESNDLQASEADLHQLGESCLEVVGPTAALKGLSLRLEIAAGLPASVPADPLRLRQLLLNLLGNAVKFTADGEVVLRMTAAAAVLRIEVLDTGPGIAAEQVPRLFQEFERLDTDIAAATEGAGLGLALCVRFAAMLGGRLGHADNPGGGSIFWLELALEPARSTEAANDQPTAGPLTDRPYRVLVVDDVAMNIDIASAFLEVLGHEVTCATGGAEGVEMASAADFDVVLMDIRMPEVDGLEATRRIRALPGARGRVPIIALTAQAFAEQVRDCLRAGMDGHLSKPFTQEALFAAVAGAVGRTGSQALAHAAQVGGVGMELPVFDQESFDRAARFLAPDVVASYLRRMSARGEALANDLQEPGALIRMGSRLAESAHMLSGSASMFGFKRLSAVALAFERAVQDGSQDAVVLSDRLYGTVLDALAAMPPHRSAARQPLALVGGEASGLKEAVLF